MWYLISLCLHLVLSYYLLQIRPDTFRDTSGHFDQDISAKTLGHILFFIYVTPGIRTFFVCLLIYHIMYKGDAKQQ